MTCLISAIDIALWDIKGKVLGAPVYQLLGGPVRESVPLYTHVHDATGDDTLEDALGAQPERAVPGRFPPRGHGRRRSP